MFLSFGRDLQRTYFPFIENKEATDKFNNFELIEMLIESKLSLRSYRKLFVTALEDSAHSSCGDLNPLTVCTMKSNYGGSTASCSIKNASCTVDKTKHIKQYTRSYTKDVICYVADNIPYKKVRFGRRMLKGWLTMSRWGATTWFLQGGYSVIYT